MNYSKIKKYDISNGLGIRCSIFFTGCNFHCPECFNPELWDKNSGKPFDENVKTELFSYQHLTKVYAPPAQSFRNMHSMTRNDKFLSILQGGMIFGQKP